MIYIQNMNVIITEDMFLQDKVHVPEEVNLHFVNIFQI